MYSPSDLSYQQTKKIKLGEYQLPGLYQSIIDWIHMEFNVKALNFSFDSKKEYNQQVVCLIVETPQDCTILEKDNNEEKIANRFLMLLQGGEWRDLVPRDVIKNDVLALNPEKPPEMLVAFCPFSTIAIKELYQQVTVDTFKAIEKKFKSSIWKISTNNDTDHTVFYHTDAQYDENAKKGVNDQVRSEFVKILKKFDAFGYLNDQTLSLRFDSKENFDQNFSSNWHYYYQ